jgi:hypothetical protein
MASLCEQKPAQGISLFSAYRAVEKDPVQRRYFRWPADNDHSATRARIT